MSKNDQSLSNELNIYDLIELLDSKIKKELLQTNYLDREDLEQEIKLKIIEIENKIDLIDAPEFWDFYQKKSESKFI